MTVVFQESGENERWDLKGLGIKNHTGINGHDEIVLIVSSLCDWALTIGWDRGIRSYNIQFRGHLFTLPVVCGGYTEH